jgi:MoxR-like ATPase
MEEVTNNLRPLNDLAAKINDQIIGQRENVDLLLAALLANGHVLLEGVPGLAKTTLAKTLAFHIDGVYKRIQFTPDLMPSDVIGTMLYNSSSNAFTYKKGPVFANILLIDEINRAPAKTQAALFEAMQERQVSMEGKTYTLPDPFLVIATQNPVEYEGTYKLPEAQLDRFLFKLEMKYPDNAAEQEIVQRFHQGRLLAGNAKPEVQLTLATITSMQKQLHEVHASDELLKYTLELARQTRSHAAIYLGASTRAALHLLSGAKAMARIQGRDFITPDDVRMLFLPVMRHRLVMTPEAEMEGRSLVDVFAEIADSVEVPR